ncbi:MAG TPA: hypothetical protein DFI01_05725 [Bacteroidales bacterium]|nr:hypothetical protein [Bacteroidales bacterium]
MPIKNHVQVVKDFVSILLTEIGVKNSIFIDTRAIKEAYVYEIQNVILTKRRGKKCNYSVE